MKRHWSFVYFCVVSLISLVSTLRQPFSGHFDIFSVSARLLWSGQNPHGIHYLSGPWPYSPACGMFFFGAFAYLPYQWGLGLYILSSWAVFVAGAWTFIRVWPLERRWLHFFWFLVSSEMIGSILNARVEIMMTGVILFVGAWLIEGRRLFGAAFLLAMVCNWKFTPFPAAGLLCLVSLFRPALRRFPWYFVASLAFWFGIPFAFFRPAFVFEMHRVWIDTLSLYMLSTNNWQGFPHVFGFLHRVFGVDLSFYVARRISGALGLLLGGALAWHSWKYRERLTNEVCFWALGLGAGFTLVFSPLSQSAAYIGYAPLLYLCLWKIQKTEPRGRTFWWGILGMAWFLISLAYSDLVPRDLRLKLVMALVKPVGVLVLMIPLILSYLRSSPSRESSDKISS